MTLPSDQPRVEVADVSLIGISPIYYTCSIRHNFAYIYSSYSNLPDNTDIDVIFCYVPLFTQRSFSGIYPVFWDLGISLFISLDMEIQDWTFCVGKKSIH